MEVNQRVSPPKSPFVSFYNFVSASSSTSMATCLACDSTFHNDEYSIRLHVNTTDHLKKLIASISDKLQKGTSVPQLLMDMKYFYIHQIILFDERILCCVICMQKINIDYDLNDVNVLATAADNHIRSSTKHIEFVINTLHNNFDRGLLTFDTNLQHNVNGTSLFSSTNSIGANSVTREGIQNDFGAEIQNLNFVHGQPLYKKEGITRPNENKTEKTVHNKSLMIDFEQNASYGGLQNEIKKKPQCDGAVVTEEPANFIFHKSSSVKNKIPAEEKFLPSKQKSNVKSEPILGQRNYEAHRAKLSKFDEFFAKDEDEFILALNNSTKKTLSMEFANMLAENHILHSSDSKKYCKVCKVNITNSDLKDHLLLNSHIEKNNTQLEMPTLAEVFNINLKEQAVIDYESDLRSLYEVIDVYWKNAMLELESELKQIRKYEHELAICEFDSCQPFYFRYYVSQLKKKYSETGNVQSENELQKSDESDDLYDDIRLSDFSKKAEAKPSPIAKSAKFDSISGDKKIKIKNTSDKPVLEKSVANFFDDVKIGKPPITDNLDSQLLKFQKSKNEVNKEFEDVLYKHKIAYVCGSDYKCNTCNVDISSLQNCLVHIRGKGHLMKMSLHTDIKCSEGVEKLANAPKNYNAYKPDEKQHEKGHENNYKKQPNVLTNNREEMRFKYSTESLPNIPVNKSEDFKNKHLPSHHQPQRNRAVRTPSPERATNFKQSHKRDSVRRSSPEPVLSNVKRSALLQLHNIFPVADGFWCKLCSCKLNVITDVIDHILTVSHKNRMPLT